MFIILLLVGLLLLLLAPPIFGPIVGGELQKRFTFGRVLRHVTVAGLLAPYLFFLVLFAADPGLTVEERFLVNPIGLMVFGIVFTLPFVFLSFLIAAGLVWNIPDPGKRRIAFYAFGSAAGVLVGLWASWGFPGAEPTVIIPGDLLAGFICGLLESLIWHQREPEQLDDPWKSGSTQAERDAV